MYDVVDVEIEVEIEVDRGCVCWLSSAGDRQNVLFLRGAATLLAFPNCALFFADFTNPCVPTARA